MGYKLITYALLNPDRYYSYHTAMYEVGNYPPNYPVPSTIFLAYCWEETKLYPVNRYWQPNKEGK